MLSKYTGFLGRKVSSPEWMGQVKYKWPLERAVWLTPSVKWIIWTPKIATCIFDSSGHFRKPQDVARKYQIPRIMDVFHWAFDTNKTSFFLKPSRFLPDLVTKCGCHWQAVRLTLVGTCKDHTGVNMQEGRVHRLTRKSEHGSTVKGAVLSAGQNSPSCQINSHIDMLIHHVTWNEIYLIFGRIRWIVRNVPTYI